MPEIKSGNRIHPLLKGCFYHYENCGVLRSTSIKNSSIRSNTVYFEGERTVQEVPSLTYILGDEGSGSYIGQKIISF